MYIYVYVCIYVIFFHWWHRERKRCKPSITMRYYIFISLLKSRRGQLREQKADETQEQVGEKALQTPPKVGPWVPVISCLAGDSNSRQDRTQAATLVIMVLYRPMSMSTTYPRTPLPWSWKGYFESQNQTCSSSFLPPSWPPITFLPSLLHIHSSLHRVSSFFQALW